MNRQDLIHIPIEITKPQEFFPQPIRFMKTVTSTPGYDSKRQIPVIPHCLFHYTLSGEGEYEFKGKFYKVQKGQVFFWTTQSDDFSYRYPPDGKETWKFICLCFIGEGMYDLSLKTAEQYGPVFTLNEDCQSIRNFLGIMKDKEYISLSCAEGMKLIWNLFEDIVDSYIANSNEVMHPTVKAIKRLINSNLTEDMTISGIARHLNLSREHISRLFFSYTGKSLKDYIKEQKLNYACKLLIETNYSTNEIAEILKYSSGSNFIRAFHSAVKMTPKEYRDLSIPLFLS